MSKEIILDGVNVAECRHLSFVEEDYCCDCQYEKYALCQNSDCYYKQLKRLQAENELIKRLLNDILRIFNLGQYDFLKDQNEIIMALEKAVQKDKDFFEFVGLKQENEELKLALEEIREICKSVEFPLMSKMINIIDEVLR